MDFMPPGRVVKVGDPRWNRYVIRDGLGQYWAGEESRWREKPGEAILFHTEVAALRERNRCCLGDCADTFTATVVVTVHVPRWSRKELARHLDRHGKFYLPGVVGKSGLSLEIVPDTLRKVKP